MERVKGIEPSYEAWEAAVLPLNYTRTIQYYKELIGHANMAWARALHQALQGVVA